MDSHDHQSWGRYPRAQQNVRHLYWITDDLNTGETDAFLLPYGLGRSYGDCCLNDGGTLLDASRLDRFIQFDAKTGILRCEAGVSLADILDLVVPKGWFLPVTPGTKFVTVGGAIANDVHGKNHHRAGTFGHHTLMFDLVRSSGERKLCSPSENPEWYHATIGGIGLTGLVTWAEIQLKRIRSAQIEVETIRFENLPEFFSLSAESDRDFEYTVAWMDGFAKNESFGRGIFMRGNHADNGQDGPAESLRAGTSRSFTIPFDAPDFLLNAHIMKLYNSVYFHKHSGARLRNTLHFEPFFYPLDALGQWNRLYGKRGFFQYQCVIPEGTCRDAAGVMLKTISRSSERAYLAVLKIFGDVESRGMLSFPRKGLTLALDFPNRGQATLDLFDRMDDIVRQAGGALYPAKDARMSANSFDACFPHWREFARYIDPKFSSNFWRRVTGNRQVVK